MRDTAINEFERHSPNMKFLVLLAAACRQSGGTLRLKLSEIAAVNLGNSLTYDYENDELVLRYQERGQTFVIGSPSQARVPAPPSEWPSDQESGYTPPALRAQRASVKTDEQLAELEAQRAQVQAGVSQRLQQRPTTFRQ
jgi:lipopolysaccharide export system protein LptC